MRRYKSLLIAPIVLIAVGLSGVSAQIPKDLKEKWQGDLVVFNDYKQYKGSLEIQVSPWEAKNPDPILFMIRDFSSIKRRDYQYITVKPYIKGDDVGFVFDHVIPDDDYIGVSEGTYFAELKQHKGIPWLVVEFRANDLSKNDYHVEGFAVLFKKKDVKKVREAGLHTELEELMMLSYADKMVRPEKEVQMPVTINGKVEMKEPKRKQTDSQVIASAPVKKEKVARTETPEEKTPVAEPGKMGVFVEVRNGVLSDRTINYKPLKYNIINTDKTGIELLGRVPVGTPVTLINSTTGARHHTKVVRQMNKKDILETYGDIYGNYVVSILERQPVGWKLGNFESISMLTVILNKHLGVINKLSVTPLNDPDKASELESKIRNNPNLFNEIFIKGYEQFGQKYLLGVAQNNAVLPEVSKIGDTGILYIKFFYEYAGKSFLYYKDTFYPLFGNCTKGIPFAYKHEDKIHIRFRAGGCESGETWVSQYVVIQGEVIEEWYSDGYSN